MSDPTKNLPWKVVRMGGSVAPEWQVRDSTNKVIFHAYGPYAEETARMVAAGSVAGELYAALEPFVKSLEEDVKPQAKRSGELVHDDAMSSRLYLWRRATRIRVKHLKFVAAALALAAPLLAQPTEGTDAR